MIVAQTVDQHTSKFIPTSEPALFAGMAITRSGQRVTSTAGNPTVLGILQADLPTFISSPQTVGPIFNQSRMGTLATNGRLAIRVAAGQFASLSNGGIFGLLNGEAVLIGFLGALAATTINGNSLIIDEKVMGADGVGYILVYFN
jgi:hypothetical protein